MSYAALAYAVLQVVVAGLAYAVGVRVGRANLAIERHWRQVAEARADRQAELATQAQPDRSIAARDVVNARDDRLLLDAVFGPPDATGWVAEIDPASGSGSVGNDSDDGANAAG